VAGFGTITRGELEKDYVAAKGKCIDEVLIRGSKSLMMERQSPMRRMMTLTFE